MLQLGTRPIELAIATLQRELERRTEAPVFGHAERLRRAVE
jgi:hypothetical protein